MIVGRLGEILKHDEKLPEHDLKREHLLKLGTIVKLNQIVQERP
ncbi:hypothetical protein GCM10008018_26780 [Paenibacillus marchantiophytorum]|uniref:Uncharacterized protein n=1 Tax=Paenibacillus marchantiophytorum TaxID=1619310 RepID=A0ABQ1EP46_9BACL|nr:hypothetical protein GCM10008018_26780 [Paenibacillus marchantiophytorum]